MDHVLHLGWGRTAGPTPPAEVFTLAELWARRGLAEMARTQRPGFHLVVLATDARLRQDVDFRPVTLRRGEALHVHPGQVVRWHPPPPGREGGLLLVTGPTAVPDAVGWFPGAAPAVTRLSATHAGELVTAYAAVRAEVERCDAGDPTAAALVLALTRVVVLRAARGAAAPPEPVATPAAYTAFRVELEASLGTTHLVADVARACGWSTRTVTRACLRVTGRSAKQLLDERLVLEAQRLLALTDLPVAEIGARLGWSEATNFTKAFRRVTGVAPSRFRDTRPGPA